LGMGRLGIWLGLGPRLGLALGPRLVGTRLGLGSVLV